jgi:putative transposase
MPRAHGVTVPRAAPPDQAPGLNRRLRRWLGHEFVQLRPVLARSAAACAADRDRKHFGSFGHACLPLFHGLAGRPSLRQSYAAFAACPALAALSGLRERATPDAGLNVGFAQVAASSTSRPAAFLAGLVPVPVLAARVRVAGPRAGAPPADLHLLDSTFVRLSLKLAAWLPGAGGHDVPGGRVQVQYAPAFDLPEHVVVTDTRTNDCQGLDQILRDDPARLAALRDQTLIIDLGYYSPRRFARLRMAGVHFVTRLKADARLTVDAAPPVQAALPGAGPGRVAVRTDERVTVGSPNNRAGAVLAGLRLVTADVAPTAKAARRGATAVVYRVLTDRWDLTAVEVVQLYLARWQIELFFRWLKCHIRLPRRLGDSRNAGELTVWLALVVHLLTLLAAHALGLTRRSPALRWQVLWALAQLEPDPAHPPDPPARPLSFPGWPLAP